MPNFVIKNNDAYNIFSTIVDAPYFESALTLEQLRGWYKDQYGEQGMVELPARLERVDRTGSSALQGTLADLITTNRAGPNESTLSKSQFVAQYLTLPPNP